MKQTRTPILIIVLALMCFLGTFLSGSTHSVQAATSADLTLVGDIGLPENVVQVMLDNSLDANGKTPDLAVDAVTVRDVQSWQTISLANRQLVDGAYQSTTNSTVANWIANLQTNTDEYVETPDMLLYKDIATNSDAQAYTPGMILTVGIPQAYGRTKSYLAADVPVYNKLIAVLMSATSAKTIDLTCLTSKVADAPTRVKMLAMFRTSDMPNLLELDLGYNAFGDGLVSGWGYDAFCDFTLNSSSVQTWNLSFEGLTSLDSRMLKKIGTQTKNVNLASNSLTQINWNNSLFLDNIGADGSVDMTGSNQIDDTDSGTVTTILTLFSNGGKTVVPDNVANGMIVAALTTGDLARLITPTTLNVVGEQLSGSTLTTLASFVSNSANDWTQLKPVMASDDLDVSLWPATSLQEMSDDAFASLVSLVSADNAEKLQAKRKNGDSGGTDPDAGTASVVVNGNWQFNYQLGQTDTTLATDDVVSLTGVIPKGQTLTVAMAAWHDGAKTIAPTLSFGQTGSTITVAADNTAVPVIVNTSGAAILLDNVLHNVALALSAQDIASFSGAAAYSGTLTWSIENVPSTTFMR